MGECESKRNMPKRTIFFNIHKTDINKENQYQNYKTPIKLEFNLEGCEKNNKYQIKVMMNDSNKPFLTEIAKVFQQIMTFNTCYICEYFFERHQHLNIRLFKNGEHIGNAKTTLGMIVGSPNSTYKTVIGSKGENIVINAQSLNDVNSYIDFDFIVKPDNRIDFSENNNKIGYRILTGGRLVFQSDPISSFGKFEPIRIPLAVFEQEFTIYFYNYRQENLIYKIENINNFMDTSSISSFY